MCWIVHIVYSSDVYEYFINVNYSKRKTTRFRSECVCAAYKPISSANSYVRMCSGIRLCTVRWKYYKILTNTHLISFKRKNKQTMTTTKISHQPFVIYSAWKLNTHTDSYVCKLHVFSTSTRTHTQYSILICGNNSFFKKIVCATFHMFRGLNSNEESLVNCGGKWVNKSNLSKADGKYRRSMSIIMYFW